MNEQKKTQILICLFVVVIGVGAFQVLGHKRPPAVPDPKKTPTVETTPSATTVADNSAPDPTAIKNPQVANDLPDRDPFDPPAADQPKDPNQAKAPVADAPTPIKHHSMGGSGFKPFDPLPSSGGSISPMKGTLGSPTIQPKGNDYALVGVIEGAKPMALFADGSGNQKLVSVGGSIDNDTKLTGIDMRSVSIESRGQRRRLSVGGNPVGK